MLAKVYTDVPAPLLAQMRWTLRFKIFWTLLLWVWPSLLVPASYYPSVGIPSPEPLIFVKLMGIAFLALVVGYGFGLCDVWAGRISLVTLLVGIVSNGGACAILWFLFFRTDAFGTFDALPQGWLGKGFFVFSGVLLFLITASLLWILLALLLQPRSRI